MAKPSKTNGAPWWRVSRPRACRDRKERIFPLRRTVCWVAAVFLAVGYSVALPAQQAITLGDGIRIALESNPTVQAAEAGEMQAKAGIAQAKSGFYPRVRFAESYQRSNNPVFVFGSLLNQRQFTEANFDVNLLNNPDALNNFQSRLGVEQRLFDSRRTRHAVRAAGLRKDIVGEQRRGNDADVILRVVETYFGAVLAAERLQVAEQAVKSAEADLRRAEAMFEAGMTTRADVLSVQVHRADMEEERIRAAHDLQTARAAVNDALGVALDSAYDFTTPLSAAVLSASSLEEYEGVARQKHPGLRQAGLQRDLAKTELDLSKTAFWPQVVATGVLEADRQRFGSRGGGNWLAGVSLRWDLWNGSETRARVAGARHAWSRAEALERRADSAVRLQIRSAYFRLQSAAQRVGVAAAAVSQAEESQRIIQNRYQAGLTTVTELIRSQTAYLAAQIRHLAALYDQRVAAAALEHAAGNLTPDSEVLR